MADELATSAPGPRSTPTGALSPDATGTPRLALSATGLRKAYGPVRAVDGVDLHLAPGEIRGLLGPNGAGKTTLLRMLSGLVVADAGAIELFGSALTPGDVTALEGVAGFVEEPAFYPYLSGRANLEVLAHLDDSAAPDRIDDVLRMVSLADSAGVRVGGYSTGMRQRLGIAACLLRAPRLLLLDEPTSGLDPAGLRELAALLHELADQGIAVLVSSHQIAELQDVCDSFTIVRRGQVVWEGTAAELRRSSPAAEYHLVTSADDLALELASGRPGLTARAVRDGGLGIAARSDALDAYVVELGARGIAVRTLEPTLGPLEAMYFALTGQDAPEQAGEAPASEPGAGMAVVPASVTTPGPVPSSGRERVLSACRVELRKLRAQLWTRVLALICVLGPFAFAAVLKLQSGVPADALFGVWVHTSGYAVSLVILSFGAQWGFPVIAGILAGDLLSGEDRHGTWKTLLTRSRSRRELFLGKLAAVSVMAVGMAVLLAVASVLAGVLLIGGQSLVGLGGTLIPSGRALLLVLASWALNLPPLLGFVALALFVSARSRNGIVGVLTPLLASLIMQLLALIGNGAWPHALLLSFGLGDWHGLFASPAFLGPVLVGTLVSLAWVAALLAGTWAALRRRDFADNPTGRRADWKLAGRVVLAGAAALIVLVVAMSWGPGAITPARMNHSFAPTFSNLTVLQQRWLGRYVPPGAKLDQLTTCQRRSTTSTGSGDWACNVAVIIPSASNPLPVEQTVTYDVSVQSNGCYKAESPPSFVGAQLMQVSAHHSVVNPLYTIYGCFNPL